MIEIKSKNRNVEKIEKKNYKQTKVKDRLINRMSKAKNISTYLQAQLGIIKKDKIEMSNVELIIFIEEILIKYDDLDKEKIKARLELNGWKGKDTINYIEHPDKFELILHRKKDQDSDPVEIKKEITKDEVNRVIWAINHSNFEENTESKQRYLETPEIARNYCIISKLTQSRDGRVLLYENGDFDWKIFFASRELHTNLNLCLRILDNYQAIHYRAGKIIVLKKIEEIDTIL